MKCVLRSAIYIYIYDTDGEKKNLFLRRGIGILMRIYPARSPLNFSKIFPAGHFLLQRTWIPFFKISSGLYTKNIPRSNARAFDDV